eukprot:6173551-Pleurochrysis_carterae.AAC.1
MGEGGRVTPGECIPFCCSVANARAHSHSYPRSPQAKLIDLGTAARCGAHERTLTGLAGTPIYVAPEAPPRCPSEPHAGP